MKLFLKAMLTPRLEGSIAIRSSSSQFVQALRHRVASGLFMGHPHPRSNYRIDESGGRDLHVRAADWRTAVNVGLNELDLRFPNPGVVHYQVRFWRWASYAIILSGILGVIGLILLVTADVPGYVTRHPASRLPGLSIEQNVLIAWTMVLFWGFVWPWLLIALHKRPLRELIERLVNEIGAVATSG